jgi:hypothetical protein
MRISKLLKRNAQTEKMRPLFRGLAASLLAAFNSGQPDVIRAKKLSGYYPEMLESFIKAKTSSNPRDFKLAYDNYYELVYKNEDRVVKAITGHPRKFWFTFEEKFK